jgi:hypothetical protein
MIGRVNWQGLAASLIVLAFGVGFLVWAQSYGVRTRAVPVLVAWLAIVLALIDAAAQFDAPWGRFLRRFVTAKNIIEWKPQGGQGAGEGRALQSVLWVAGYVAGVIVAGVYLATPAYVFLYMLLHGRKSARTSVIASAAIALALWLVFGLVFRYSLYEGMIFGAD